MLKLDQINMKERDTLIVEVLEPIVYEKVGTVLKTDEIIAREKANVHYILAKIVRVPNVPQIAKPIEDEDAILEATYNVGDIVMLVRQSIAPITFPIEGYDSPKLGTISSWSIFAVIDEETI